MEKLCTGIKFCGGCNPRYDRGAFYAQIKETFGSCSDFESAVPEKAYDVLLILAGCGGCYDSFAAFTGSSKIYLSSCDTMEELEKVYGKHRKLVGE